MGTNDRIVSRARELCLKYGTRDPFRIAKELGVHIHCTDSLHRLKGMYTVIKRNRIIILNSGNTQKMNRIVCAHELGHDQHHRDYAKNNVIQEFMLYDMSTRMEYEANIFAASLLLEDESILAMIESGYDTEQIAAATKSDINLVALKVDCLIQSGCRLHRQDHDSRFLK